MSAEVESLPRNGDFDDEDFPQDLNGGNVSGDDGDLFGDDDDDDELDKPNEYDDYPSSTTFSSNY